MGARSKITRLDHDAAALRAVPARINDGAQVRQMLALALVLEGRPRSEAFDIGYVLDTG